MSIIVRIRYITMSFPSFLPSFFFTRSGYINRARIVKYHRTRWTKKNKASRSEKKNNLIKTLLKPIGPYKRPIKSRRGAIKHEQTDKPEAGPTWFVKEKTMEFVVEP